jgi:hypothetical protein
MFDTSIHVASHFKETAKAALASILKVAIVGDVLLCSTRAVLAQMNSDKTRRVTDVMYPWHTARHNPPAMGDILCVALRVGS